MPQDPHIAQSKWLEIGRAIDAGEADGYPADRAFDALADLKAEHGRYHEALHRLDHLLAAPGGLSVAEMQAEGRRVIKEALR